MLYLLNRCHTKALHDTTLFEMFSGRTSRVRHLKVFGSICCFLVPSNLSCKLQPTSTKEIFVGYGTYEKGYRIYNPSTRQVIISRDALFNEDAKWDCKLNTVKEIKMPLITSVVENGNEDEIDFVILDQSSLSIGSSLQQDQGETSSSQSPNSSVQISNIDSEVIDSTPLRWKSINEVC